jgi:hypothetical protein
MEFPLVWQPIVRSGRLQICNPVVALVLGADI